MAGVEEVMSVPKVAICGPSRCGKDTAAAWFHANTPLRMGKATSEIILPVAAERLGLSLAEAFARRHEDRKFWFDVANELRLSDSAYLARRVLEDSDIVVGVRSRDELITCRREGLVDLVIWIDRDVPPDPTLEYGPDLCDVVIGNRGTREGLYSRLEAFSRFSGILKAASLSPIGDKTGTERGPDAT